MIRRDILAMTGTLLFGRTGLAKLLKVIAGRRAGDAAAVSGLLAGLSGCNAESASPRQETPTVPAWLSRIPAFQWAQIANTAMTTIRSSPDYARIQGAGLDPGDGSFGDPQKGIYAFSGGTIKGGTTMLVFGGGGAGAWAGNEVRALDLSDDVPIWRIPVGPSPASAVWNRFAQGRSSHVYMQDCKPNARHSYWGPQFIDSHGPFANSFFIFMCGQVWETDADMAFPDQQTVDSLDWTTRTWRAPGTHAFIPANRTWAGPWTCKHPATEDVFVATYTTVQKWSALTNAWTKVCDAPADITHRGMAAIDPDTDTILRLGWSTGAVGAAFNAHAIDISTGRLTVGPLTGPAVNSIVVDSFAAILGGLVYDPGLRCFLLFQGNGRMLKITRAADQSWYVDFVEIAGTPPPVDTRLGQGALAGRMQYVAALKGVCILFDYRQNAYFVRTSL